MDSTNKLKIGDPMVAAWIKVLFGLVTAGLYWYVAQIMISGALSKPGFSPNTATDWIVTVTGAAIITFVAAQIGVVVGSAGGGNPLTRLKSYLGASDWVVVGVILVLVVDLIVLTYWGFRFVQLYVEPARIAVAPGTDPLTVAPEYISLQAQSLIGLVVAGAAGVGVAAVK